MNDSQNWKQKTASLAAAWGMVHDELLSKLIRNVLHHFGVEGED